jgi:hypothetical protein
MSFLAQEQLMFDLLFDKNVRSAFVSNKLQALAAYDLTESEKKDFMLIRTDALELDAAIRIDLILSQMIRHFPLVFALFSSYPQGLDCIRAVVEHRFPATAPLQRAVYFGTALRDHFSQLVVVQTRENRLTGAVIEAELAMAYTASALKSDILQQGEVLDNNPVVHENWLNLPVSLAPYVSASIIPLPYQQLKQALCPAEGAELWRQLSAVPFNPEKRHQLFARPDIRLLLSRAYISRYSPCEPAVEFATAELSEGFAPLFQYVNGECSIAFILQELQRAGADAVMINTIKRQFHQLLESGMLMCLAG